MTEDPGDQGTGLDQAGTAALVFAEAGAVGSSGPRRRVAELYSVFARPANEADTATASLARASGALDLDDLEGSAAKPAGVSEEEWRSLRPGKVLAEQGRVLLRGLGGAEDTVYAAPTENDHVRVALFPNGGGGCGTPGPDGLTLNWSYSTARSLVVYGLVSDEIASVDVLIAGKRHAARMGENAFGIRLDGTKPSELDAVVLTRRDGSTRQFPLSVTHRGS